MALKPTGSPAFLYVRFAAVNVPRGIHQKIKVKAVLFAKINQAHQLPDN